ncbi:MAG: DUF3320 domain-containing protein [Planctomycetes bacterium]|nr:DUF3320 domain-containing protein [Planctomycetota bacterium]
MFRSPRTPGPGEVDAAGDAAPGLRLEFELDPSLNLAMQQNGVSPLRSLTLENSGAVELRDIVVRLRAEPEFAAPLELHLAALAPHARHVWSAPPLSLSLSFLAGLRERVEGALHFEVQAADDAPLEAHGALAVLAYDQWGGLQSLPELLCAFVLPNHPALAPWLRRAAALLEEWTQDPSLGGYQSHSRERCLKTSAAIFHALQEAGIAYVSPPASFEATGQKVRTAERIQEEKLATCLDLALAAAACLEQAGLNALVVTVAGHAFTGVWLEESSFPEPALEDGALLGKRIALGEIAVFDPTLATHRPARSFEDALRAAQARLQDPREFRCVIDVARSRKGGVRPLPLRAHGVELQAEGEPGSPTAAVPAPNLALPRAVALAAEASAPDSRIERWKRHLLDLTNRNRLLNFLPTKKTVPLECSALGRLEDLCSSGRLLTLRERLTEMQAATANVRPLADEAVRRLVEAELDAGRLVTPFTEAELAPRLTEIFRAAREGLEEGGASGLYLALGFLEWYESPTSDRPRLAPLLLVPVDLQRGSIRQGFKLARAADETRFNTTLLEMLRAQHHVEIPGMDPLPEDAQGVDVDTLLLRVTEALRDVPRWRVLHQACLGFFTFAKFLMWKDLDEQSAVLLANPLVAHLAQQPERAFDPAWREPDYAALDETQRSAELHCPVLADSSQLAAVIAAADGKSFVLEGPPGTGKSQTITNLIAHCLAQGKTVLFVSEKTAALNVVFDRLKAIGLERFCLELHSSKASKQEVVQSLGHALRGARPRAPEEWSALADELDGLRGELNAYARAVWREHANGCSVFRATSILTTLRAAARVELGWDDLADIERASLEVARGALREAVNALQVTGEPHAHALAGIGLEDVSAGLAERIRASFEALRVQLAALPEAAQPLFEALALDPATAGARELRLAAAACQGLLTAPARGAALLAVEPRQAESAVVEACRLGRQRAALRAELARRFDLRLLELDLLGLRGRVRAALDSWFFARWWRTRALRRDLLGVTQPGVVLTLDELWAALEKALALKDAEASLAGALSALHERARCDWRAEGAPWAEIETSLAWAQRTRAALDALAPEPTVVQGLCERALSHLERGAGGGPPQRALAALTGVLDAAEATAELLRLAADDPWRTAHTPRRLAAWLERMQRIEPALAQLKPWALWRRLRARLVQARLGALVSALEAGELRSVALPEAFERSYLEAWLELQRAREPALHNFLALSHEQRIARFRQLDAQCLELARKVVAARLAARVPSVGAESVPGSELGVLQRQLQLQRPRLGLRRLFQQTKTLVQRLKPCFLMSPISVAQYLPPGELAFDLVVFDEASQIPTWDAVGAIARGRQAIVVGDSKQLPPTSFFEVVVSADEDAEDAVEDLESILDECRAANVPALDLRWHYRSRHESLITFSNRKYYANRLHTFPAARFAGLGVQWRHVAGGVYDKSRSRTNRVEAEALVAEVLRRLRDPELARHSIGIVTFSAAQQGVIEDRLDEERRKDPALDPFFLASEERRETLFVKNLENVQGDERDVILFSICYGPDENGRVALNFGPLNQQGGARRLNVAVTRARRELLVFSTLRAEQIDLARTRARGVSDLKAFLSYAQHGVSALPAEVLAPEELDAFESPLEAEICAALRALGHEVVAQVGCSGYRIDLAVVDPERPGQYLLGIECDGRNYHSAPTARDRDRLRQAVLEGLGWQLVRVWSSDWWEAREEQLVRLGAVLEEALRKARAPEPPSPPSTAPPTTAPPPPLASTPAARAPQAATPNALAAERVAEAVPLEPYRVPRGTALGSQQDFYDAASARELRAALLAAVEQEGPLCLELAAARVARRFGFERVRQKVLERVDEVARQAGLTRTAQGARAILWPRGVEPTAWRAFRTSASDDPDLREAEELPWQEIANAAAHLLAANGACPRLELQRALSRLFGFRALGAALAAQMDAGIECLVAAGRARLDADGRVELVV